MTRVYADSERYVEAELAPGIHWIYGWDRESSYWLTTTEPVTLWVKQVAVAEGQSFRWANRMAGGRTLYVQPSWWDKLCHKPYRGAVPHARVVTR